MRHRLACCKHGAISGLDRGDLWVGWGKEHLAVLTNLMLQADWNSPTYKIDQIWNPVWFFPCLTFVFLSGFVDSAQFIGAQLAKSDSPVWLWGGGKYRWLKDKPFILFLLHFFFGTSQRSFLKITLRNIGDPPFAFSSGSCPHNGKQANKNTRDVWRLKDIHHFVFLSVWDWFNFKIYNNSEKTIWENVSPHLILIPPPHWPLSLICAILVSRVWNDEIQNPRRLCQITNMGCQQNATVNRALLNTL